MTSIVIETLIKAPRELCFDLARDVEIHAESAAFSGERIVEPGRRSGLLGLGDLITMEGRHFGIRQRFTAKIVEMDRPNRFVDEMVKGTFRRLRHVHEFHERDEATLMRDILEWDVLWLADLFLKRHMRWFVTKKQQRLKEIIERR